MPPEELRGKSASRFRLPIERHIATARVGHAAFDEGAGEPHPTAQPGIPRVVRLSEIGFHERRLILALLAAKRAADVAAVPARTPPSQQPGYRHLGHGIDPTDAR